MFKDFNDEFEHHESQNAINEVEAPYPHKPGAEPIRNESPLNATPPMFGKQGFGAFLSDMDKVGLDTQPENALEAQNPPISNQNYSKINNCGTRSDADAGRSCNGASAPAEPKE